MYYEESGKLDHILEGLVKTKCLDLILLIREKAQKGFKEGSVCFTVVFFT